MFSFISLYIFGYDYLSALHQWESLQCGIKAYNIKNFFRIGDLFMHLKTCKLCLLSWALISFLLSPTKSF